MKATEHQEYTTDADCVDDEREPRTEESPEDAPSLLEMLLEQAHASPPALAERVDGIVIGRVLELDDSGVPRVTFSGSPADGFAARSMTMLRQDDRGREVALMFEEGDPRRPVVMGRVVSPLAAGPTEAAADGRRIEISAEEEIVLRCGQSSITLTRAGKIVLRGAYVLSRSSGVNRIQGGSVEIN